MSKKIIRRIDKDRGDVSRSKFVQRMLEKSYPPDFLKEYREDQQQTESQAQPRTHSAAISHQSQITPEEVSYGS